MRHRLTILATGAALFVGACGTKDAADTNANSDTGLTADKITFNDITAIDAVTGEAANMAADVEYAPLSDTEAVAQTNDGNTASATTAAGKPVAPAKPKAPSRPAPKPVAKPVPAPAPTASPPAEPGNTSG